GPPASRRLARPPRAGRRPRPAGRGRPGRAARLRLGTGDDPQPHLSRAPASTRSGAAPAAPPSAGPGRGAPPVRRGWRAVLDRAEATTSPSRPDEEWPVRAVRDEAGADAEERDRFEALFRARYGELYSLSYRLLGDHGEAEDVVQ